MFESYRLLQHYFTFCIFTEFDLFYTTFESYRFSRKFIGRMHQSDRKGETLFSLHQWQSERDSKREYVLYGIVLHKNRNRQMKQKRKLNQELIKLKVVELLLLK
jgi:hypothetical protein